MAEQNNPGRPAAFGAGHKRAGRFGGPPGMGPVEKPKNFKGTIKRLFRYLGGYRLTVALVMVLSLCGAGFGIAGPKIMGAAITELFNGLTAKLAGT